MASRISVVNYAQLLNDKTIMLYEVSVEIISCNAREKCLCVTIVRSEEISASLQFEWH